MNRRQKIILSVTGIFLVLLLLVGLTYAYFLTRINGNENDKSISVSTAYLALQYDDGNGLLSFSNLTPGNIIGEKTFTVTNVGNATVNNYVVVLEDLVNELERKDDLKLTITCETSNSNSPCLGVSNITYPSANGIILENSIKVLTTHTYKLKIEYLEPNVDQSIDMNKKIEGKIQVYDKRNIVDIYGVVNNATSTDYVELHSVPKVSILNSENEYKFTGVLPGEHTIYVKDENGLVKGSRTIYINKGSEIDVDLDSLTITEDSGDINMDMTIDNGELELNVNSISTLPFSGSYNLNYNILYNSLNNINGTKFSETPVSKPAEEISKTYTYKDDYVISDVTFGPSGVNVTQQEYYWTYAENITYNKSTGRFSLVNPQTCKYSECYEILKNKYVVSESIGGNSSATDTLKSYTNLAQVYKLDRVDAPDTTKTVYYTDYRITADVDSAERTLSVTQDDYGTSYYYRGDVKDNYINFAGKCWRVVRIEGDGSTKLILEDQDEVCSTSINGNWDIPTTTGGTTKTGNFGYTEYDVNTLIASDGTTNSKKEYIMDYLHGQTKSSSSMATAFKNFQSTFTTEELSKMKSGDWCLADKGYSDTTGTTLLTETQMYDNKVKGRSIYYDSYVRLIGKKEKEPTLRCNGTVMKTFEDNETTPTPMYVGAITADEIVYAGGKVGAGNLNYYIINNYQKNNKLFWSLSPHNFSDTYDNAFRFYLSGNLLVRNVYDSGNYRFRPTISLAYGTVITGGNGTLGNPYIVTD